MLLADLVDVLGRTAEAPRRADKVAELAAFLRRTPIEEVDSVVALAVGTHRPAHDISGWTSTLRDEYPPADSSSLTVDDVRRVVEQVSIASGAQEVEAASRSVAALLGRANETEQAAIRSMLDPSGESAVTASVMSTAVANAARVRVGDVRRAALVVGSLPVTATLAFLEGTTALESVEPRAGRPIQPMQASPVDDLSEVAFESTCVEWAPHGLCIQAHRAGRTVSLFARDGSTSVEVTDRLPAIADIVRELPGDDLVLDGELSGAEVPDPGTIDAERRVWFYDLLFDGSALLERPLSHRRRVLDSLVPDELRLPSIETSDRGEIEAFLAVARSRGRPGVVLKDLDSVYEPGQRGRSWRQFAPVQTLDLVVVAAEWGSGRRSDKLSRLHLAARTVAGDFITVGRTAVGVTDTMLTWQTERLLQLATDEDHSGDVIVVRPEQVVEVAFDSVHETRRGGHALSLRAARVRRYRDDLRAAECDTIETVRSLVQTDQRSATPSDRTTGPRRRSDDVPPETADSMPRLPPARPPGLDAAQAEAAKRIREVLADREAQPRDEDEDLPPAIPPPEGLPVSGYLRGHVAKLDLDFEPYEEPELESGRVTHRLVMLVRFLTLGWAVALTTGALITRSEPGPIDPSLVRSIGWFGIPIAIAIAVTGWAWSDRLTRNLKRLDGRLPSRIRCFTAWMTPLAGVGLLSITVVRLEPTDVVDIRPSILVGVYAAVMWRPYSLIRRIFATLIRIRFDALLAAGYVLDLVGFGLLWWRLTTWAGGEGLTTQGDVEILIGIGAAVAVAFASNVIVWRGIIRAGDRAEAHRAASQRTRYEHRMLRLRGVDPTDPEVWWALVQRRADEQRAADELRAAEEAAAAAAAAAVDEDDLVVAEAPTAAVVPTVDELVEDVKQKHSVAFRRLGEEQSEQLEDRLRQQFSNVVGDLAGVPLETAPVADEAVDAPAIEPDATPEPGAEPEAAPDAAPTAAASTSLLDSLREIGARESREEADEEPMSTLRSVVKRAGAPRVVHPVDADEADTDAPATVEPDTDEPADVEPSEAPAAREQPDVGTAAPAGDRPTSPLDQLASRMGAPAQDPNPTRADAPSTPPSRFEPARSGSPLERLSAKAAAAEPAEPAEDRADAPAASGDGADTDVTASAEPARSGSPLDRLSARTAGAGPTAASGAAADDAADPGEGVAAATEASEPQLEPATSDNPLERLAARTEADETAAAREGGLQPRLGRVPPAGGETDPVGALKRRLGLDESVEDVKSPLQQLLDQAGTVQVEAALAEHRQHELEERPAERLVPPRLYALEWTRLLLVASFAVVTACGGWLVTEALGASGASSDGNLGDAALDVDLARRAFVGAYSVAITLIPLWTFTLLTYARRCGMDQAQPRRHLALFALSSCTCVLAFVLDGGVRGPTSALLLIPGALIAGAAGYLVEPARYWFDLPSVTLTIWTIAVPAVLGMSWLGGLLRPVDENASLEVLAFFTVTVSLMSALITVLIALSASDIEDEIRLSPELAVPLSETGRRRS